MRLQLRCDLTVHRGSDRAGVFALPQDRITEVRESFLVCDITGRDPATDLEAQHSSSTLFIVLVKIPVTDSGREMKG